MEKKVTFDWDDGPNSGREMHKMRAFSPENGESVKREVHVKRSHKNGKWSYNECSVTVPVGTIICQYDSSTHANSGKVRVWQAVEGRPMLYSCYGSWENVVDWPPTPPTMTEEVWRTLLGNLVLSTIIDGWKTREAQDIQKI